MYLCIYVCMYVCIYVCMYVCMCVCVYVCVYACMYVCMYVCMYIISIYWIEIIQRRTVELAWVLVSVLNLDSESRGCASQGAAAVSTSALVHLLTSAGAEMDQNGKEVIPRPSKQIKFRKRVSLFLVSFYMFPPNQVHNAAACWLMFLNFCNYRFSLCHSAGTLPVARTDSSPWLRTSSHISLPVLIILRRQSPPRLQGHLH